MKLLQVDWIDSCETPGWKFLSDGEQGLSHCTTVGFLLAETESYIVLAQSISGPASEEADQTSGRMCIPTVCITSRKELKAK